MHTGGRTGHDVQYTHSHHAVLGKHCSLSDYLSNAKWLQSLVYISRRHRLCITNSHRNLLKLAETCDKKGDNAQQLSGGELQHKSRKDCSIAPAN